jgi:hypothetical protein
VKSAFEYILQGVSWKSGTLRIYFRVHTDAWDRFGELEVPIEALESATLRALLLAHNQRLDQPPAEDTPLF